MAPYSLLVCSVPIPCSSSLRGSLFSPCVFCSYSLLKLLAWLPILSLCVLFLFPAQAPCVAPYSLLVCSVPIPCSSSLRGSLFSPCVFCSYSLLKLLAWLPILSLCVLFLFPAQAPCVAPYSLLVCSVPIPCSSSLHGSLFSPCVFCSYSLLKLLAWLPILSLCVLFLFPAQAPCVAPYSLLVCSVPIPCSSSLRGSLFPPCVFCSYSLLKLLAWLPILSLCVLFLFPAQAPCVAPYSLLVCSVPIPCSSSLRGSLFPPCVFCSYSLLKLLAWLPILSLCVLFLFPAQAPCVAPYSLLVCSVPIPCSSSLRGSLFPPCVFCSYSLLKLLAWLPILSLCVLFLFPAQAPCVAPYSLLVCSVFLFPAQAPCVAPYSLLVCSVPIPCSSSLRGSLFPPCVFCSYSLLKLLAWLPILSLCVLFLFPAQAPCVAPYSLLVWLCNCSLPIPCSAVTHSSLPYSTMNSAV